MKTKDIEELKDEAVNIWAEQDIYQALDHVITTLTQHHKAEVEKAVEVERKRIEKIILDTQVPSNEGSANITHHLLMAIAPTKTDKQTDV